MLLKPPRRERAVKWLQRAAQLYKSAPRCYPCVQTMSCQLTNTTNWQLCSWRVRQTSKGKPQANDCNAPRCYPCSMFADDELPADKHNWQPTKVVPNTQQTGNYLHSSHVHKNLNSPQTTSRAEHNPLPWFLKTADMYTSLVFLLVYIVILPCFHPTCITQVYLAPWAVSQLCSMSKN